MATADDYAKWIVANADKKGTPEFEVVASAYKAAKSAPAAAEDSSIFGKNSILRNVGAGALKGAADIGSTLLAPVRAPLNAGLEAVGLNPVSREANAEFFKENANPDSLSFKGGDLAANIAGTAGVGGALAKGAMRLGLSPKIIAALESGGFSLGNGAPVANTAGELGANVATRLGAGAAVGGASAGLINPSDAGAGALIGAAMPVAVKAAGEVGRGAKAAIIDPIVNQDKIIASTLARAVGPDKVNEVVAALGRKAQTPGVRFSAGESSGNPALLAMEDALRSKNPGGALNTQAGANRAALADPLQTLAQSPEAIAAAEEARKAATRPLYDAALDPANQQALTPWLKGQITQLLKRPSINEASRQAQKFAMERGEKPSPNGSLSALQDVKLALDDMIGQATSSGMGKRAAALMDTRDQLLTVMEKLSPGFAAAQSTYAAMSKPINQMQVGAALKERLIPATAENSGDLLASLNADKLARAMLHPDQVAKQATGFSGAKMADILTPDQLAMVNRVNADASRLAQAWRLGIGTGSPTARRQAIGGYIGDNFAEQAPVLNRIMEALGGVPGVNVVTKGLSGLGNMAGNKINAQMAGKIEDMLAADPQGVSNALMKALSQSNASGALMDPRLAGLLRASPVALREASLTNP